MRIHPEVKELMNKAMEEGLKYWKDKTPAEIRKRVDKQALTEQRALMHPNAKKGLAFRHVFICDCPHHPFMGIMHMPWCERKTRVEFYTPEDTGLRCGSFGGSFISPVTFIDDDTETDEEKGL